MANGPFDRLIINPREKPLSSDINQGSSQLDRALRFFAELLFSNPDNGAPQEGFVNQSLSVVASSPAGLSVKVKRGLGYQLDASAVANAIGGVVGLDDRSDYKPIPLVKDHTFAVPTAPASPNSRIDIIEVKASFLATDPQIRQVLDASTGVFKPSSVNKILTWLLDGRTETITAPANATQPLAYKVGVAGNPGIVPSTTQGYIKLAEIVVGSDVTAINADDITDTRKLLLATRKLPVAFETLLLPAAYGQGAQPELGSSPFYKNGTGTFLWLANSSGITQVDFPIVLPVGRVIQSITAHITEDGTNAHQARLYSVELGSPPAQQIGNTKTSGASGGLATLGWVDSDTGFPVTIEPGKAYNVEMQLPQSSSAALHGLVVTHSAS